MTVFICYAHEDAGKAARIYEDLRQAGLHPWLDSRDLIPGQRWSQTIKEVIKKSSHFLALLSQQSVTKRGFYQSELNHALEVLREVPTNEIFIIPVRLENVEPLHEALKELHWVDLYPDYDAGVREILRACGAKSAVQQPARKRKLRLDSVPREVPEDVLGVIQTRAERDFPDDFSTRRGRIQREIDAWSELQVLDAPNVPEDVFDTILRRATRDFPEDFATRRARVAREVAAWLELQDVVPPDGMDHEEYVLIIRKAERDFPDDFSTRRGRINREFEAWKQLYV